MSEELIVKYKKDHIQNLNLWIVDPDDSKKYMGGGIWFVLAELNKHPFLRQDWEMLQYRNYVKQCYFKHNCGTVKYKMLFSMEGMKWVRQHTSYFIKTFDTLYNPWSSVGGGEI